jgi:hypothetical protein
MIVATIAFATCGALASACGGEAGSPLPKTRAVAFADAVNLRPSDVPWLGISVFAFQNRNLPPFNSCTTRLDSSDEVVAVHSSWFLHARSERHFGPQVVALRPPVEAVNSRVYVMRTSRLATGGVAAARSASIASCVQRTIVKESSGQLIGREPRKSQIEASPLSFPLAGVVGYGWRVRGTLAASSYHLRKRPTFFEDTFGFAVGPAVIVLHASGLGLPFPATAEHRLLSRLYSRAKTSPLS